MAEIDSSTIAEDTVLTGERAIAYLSGLPVSWPTVVALGADDDVSDKCGSIRSFPVVVKAEGLSHRNHVGAVWTNVADVEEAQLAARAFGRHFGFPVTLSEQINHDGEYILGVRRSGTEDLLCLIGRGGTGVGDDVTMLLSPVAQEQVAAVVSEHVLEPTQAAKLAAALVALQNCMLDESNDEIAAIDLNPVAFAESTGELFALDAKVFIRAR
jgi:hypothetical protein